MSLFFAERWSYGGDDPALLLFTRALEAWQMPIEPGMRILEIGCCETDLARRLLTVEPTLEMVGVDVRESAGYVAENVSFLQGDINAQTFAPASFDAVISLGAIEHIGLGHYGDPRNERGDQECMVNVAKWLKPGGWLYYDVPFQPGEGVYVSQDVAWRAYGMEFLPRAKGLHLKRYAWDLDPPTGTFIINEPTEKRSPFYFIATLWERA